MPNAMTIREETPLLEMGITRHLALTRWHIRKAPWIVEIKAEGLETFYNGSPDCAFYQCSKLSSLFIHLWIELIHEYYSQPQGSFVKKQFR